MGDLISLAERRLQLEAKLTPEEKVRKAYSELQRVETALFGQPDGLSFLEMVAEDAPLGHPEPDIVIAMKNAAYVVGQDIASERYTDFKRYNNSQYESFLINAMTYFRTHEPEGLDPIYRLVSVARDFFRHQYGLPKAADIHVNNRYCSTIPGKLSHTFWSWRANKRLRKLGFEVAERKYEGLITSLPECSSETSSLISFGSQHDPSL